MTPPRFIPFEAMSVEQQRDHLLCERAALIEAVMGWEHEADDADLLQPGVMRIAIRHANEARRIAAKAPRHGDPDLTPHTHDKPARRASKEQA